MTSKSKKRTGKGTLTQLSRIANIRAIIILVLFVAVVAGFSIYLYGGSAKGSAWTSLILNYNDSRYQANSTINSSNVGSLTQKWYINTRYSVTSTPLVLDGVVYFADWDGNVYAANITNGKIIWEVNLNPDVNPYPGNKNISPISSTLAIADGKVYVADGIGNVRSPETQLFALNEANGKVVWEDTNSTFKTTMTSMWGSPTLYDGMIYVGVSGTPGPTLDNSQFKIGAIYGINATNGKLKWKFVTMIGNTGGAGVWSTPVVVPKLNDIYFGTGSTASFNGTDDKWAYSVMSLNATTGAKNWIYQVYPSSQTGLDWDFGSTPNLFAVKVNNVTYQAVGIGNKAGYYYTLNVLNGALLRVSKIGDGGDGIIGIAGFTYPNQANPMIYIPSYYQINNSVSGAVTAYLPSSNTTAWRFYTPGPIVGSVTVVPGAVLFGDDDGNVYAVSTGSGKQLFHVAFPNTQINAGITVAEWYVIIPTSYGESSQMGVYGYTT